MTLVVLLGSILGEVVRSNPGGLCDERFRVTEFGPRLNSSLIRGRQQATVSVRIVRAYSLAQMAFRSKEAALSKYSQTPSIDLDVLNWPQMI
jgi:hypothetical protein